MRSICRHRSNTYKCIARGVILVGLYLLIFSCSGSNNSYASKVVVQNVVPDAVIVSPSDQELHDTLSLQNLYIYPNPIEYFISPLPEVFSDMLDRDEALKEFQAESEIVPSDEFKRYLERKRQFIKSSIFADIP